LTGSRAATLDRAVLVLIGVVVLLAGSTFCRFYLVSWIGERVVADIRRAVFDRVTTLSPAYFEPNCGSYVFWEGDRDSNIYGMTMGFADPNFPPPTFSLWDEVMHPWLRVTSATEHFPQGRPLTS
jgi:hypothetical protein